MRGSVTVERFSDDKLHVRRWVFIVGFSRRHDKPVLALDLVSYDEGTKPTPRHRNLKFSDQRRWAGRYFRVPGGGHQRFECWCNMTGRVDASDTRGADVCEPPPLPDDVADEAMRIVTKGIFISVPEAKNLPDKPR